MVVPHLNEPDNLDHCLRALEAQRADGIVFEVIVVDNGSRVLPEEVCVKYKRTSLVREPTPGPGPARNRGADVARGRIIAFIDADCAADPDWIDSIVAYLDDNPQIGIVGGDVQVAWADPVRPTAIEAYERAFSYQTRRYVEQHNYAATGNMAVRAEVFREVGSFGGITTMEDTEWGKRATARGVRIAYLPAARVFTPACQSYAELVRRWDRHIAHEYGECSPRIGDICKWIARSLAIAASPAVELFRLPMHTELPDWRARLFAWQILARLRLYRAQRMLAVIADKDAAQAARRWNRDEAPTGGNIGDSLRSRTQ